MAREKKTQFCLEFHLLWLNLHIVYVCLKSIDLFLFWMPVYIELSPIPCPTDHVISPKLFYFTHLVFYW